MTLEHTIFNSLDKADKHSEPSLATRVNATAEDGAVETIVIQDEGCRTPAEDLERVFEKFARVSEGDGYPAGTGLGLAVAKGVIDALGGRIRPESPARVGRGTRPVVSLPAAATGAPGGQAT